jgi:hypothetical protein
MATNNVIKQKSESNTRAAYRTEYGLDVADLLETEPSDDWEAIEEFKQLAYQYD